MKFSVIALSCLVLAFAYPEKASAQVDGTWGISVSGAYDLPLFKLKDWYSGGGKVGVAALYVINDTWTAEVEGSLGKYNNGEIEDAKFLWSIDKQEHGSPSAAAEMTWLGGEITWLRHFGGGGSQLGQGGSAPYFLVGAGFARYHNDISGLIYPGQPAEPLDGNILLPPVRDRRVAVSSTVGLGLEYFTSSSLSIDVRAQYRLIFGSTRPMEAWGLDEAWPFQKVDLGVRLKLYFLQ